MKHLVYLMTLVIISFSCVNKTDKRIVTIAKNDSINSKAKHVDNETTRQISTDSLSIHEFAQLILDGSVKPSDNDETFRCLEKLMSDNEPEREFYFRVYRRKSLQADGALSEVLGGYMKTFFELYPDFCISQYNAFDTIEKKLLIKNIAYEFYASGIEYKTDIETYFTGVSEKPVINSNNYAATLNEIKIKVTNMVAEFNEKAE